MSEKIRALSWNVYFPKFAEDCSYVVDLLEREAPDVIFIQEYVGGKDDIVRAWLNENDYSFDYLPFGFDKVGKFSQGTMSAISNNLKHETKTIGLREDEPRMFRDFHNVRGVLSSIIDLGGTPIELINTHLTVARPWTRDMREREFDELVTYLGSDALSDFLLLGDFNFMPIDKRRKTLRKIGNFFTGGIINKTWSWKGMSTPIQANLDAAFWCGEDIIVHGKILPLEGYDHRPLLLEVERS